MANRELVTWPADAGGGKRASRPGLALGEFARTTICVIVAAAILVPLAIAVLGGFRTNGELMATPFGLPSPFRWSNYSSVLESRSFWRQVGNSMVVMLAATTLVVMLSSMAAFVFARFTFRGREALYSFFTLGYLFPAAVAILPRYILVRQLGLVDSLLGVILPQAAFAIPGNVIILRGFFQSVPRELEDAAYLDGATRFGFFTRILLPLAGPALAAVAVLTMVASWNNFFLPLLVLNSDTLYT